MPTDAEMTDAEIAGAVTGSEDAQGHHGRLADAAKRKAQWASYRKLEAHYEGVKRLNNPLDRGYAEACEDILALMTPDGPPWPEEI